MTVNPTMNVIAIVQTVMSVPPAVNIEAECYYERYDVHHDCGYRGHGLAVPRTPSEDGCRDPLCVAAQSVGNGSHGESVLHFDLLLSIDPEGAHHPPVGVVTPRLGR